MGRVTTRSLTLDAPSSPGRAGRSVPIGIAPPPAPSFDFVSAKVQVPVPRAGSILRTALVNRLRGAAPVPLVTLVAPAGFGKTTLLAQWASRDRRPFAWVSIDERDNDPIVFSPTSPQRSTRSIRSTRAWWTPSDHRLVDLDRPSRGWGRRGRDEGADRAGARQRRHSAAWGLGRGRRDAHRASDGGIGGRPGRARPAAPADRRSPGRRTAARGRPRDARAQPARGAAPAARDRDRARPTRMSPSS